jgi:glycosyltransferase-like protein
MIQKPLRIALLNYSTKTRGSVMQTLYLAEALQALGHEVCIFALSKGSEFCRPVNCATVLVPSQPAAEEVEALVQQRIQEFVDYFKQSFEEYDEKYDYYHAQDCISANALAILRDLHLIPHFIRTVHHIETFHHPYLQQCQDRSILQPDLCLCVSQYWQTQILQQYQVRASRVINGVVAQRFASSSPNAQFQLKQRLQLQGYPIYLTVGGIEPRKNSIALLTAFAQLLQNYPQAQLIVAGGSTFFDYSPYREQFFYAVQQTGVPLKSLILPGVISDADLPVLYHCADAFVFPSIKEGWGLVVMEAIAAQIPVITSDIPPFTEFLSQSQALLVNPESVEAIAQAMRQVLQPELAQSLVDKSQSVLSEYTWTRAAQMHLECYDQLQNLRAIFE